MNKLFDLSGKVAVVTGASTGLGSGMTKALAEAGADIVLVDHHERSETAEEVRRIGRRVLSLVGDLSTSEFINRIVSQAMEKFGDIHILSHRASVYRHLLTHLLGNLNNLGYTSDHGREGR